MKHYWNFIDSHSRYENRIVKVREDTYHFLPNNIVQDYLVLEFSDWVNVIPVTPEDEIVMIRQYRHGVKRETLEVPGGLISREDAGPGEAAAREMVEETGYLSDDIIQIGCVEPNPAIQNNRCYTFLARGAVPGSVQNLDPTEAIQVELIKRNTVYDMIRQGRITHGLVVAAFAYLRLFEG